MQIVRYLNGSIVSCKISYDWPDMWARRNRPRSSAEDHRAPADASRSPVSGARALAVRQLRFTYRAGEGGGGHAQRVQQVACRRLRQTAQHSVVQVGVFVGGAGRRREPGTPRQSGGLRQCGRLRRPHASRRVGRQPGMVGKQHAGRDRRSASETIRAREGRQRRRHRTVQRQPPFRGIAQHQRRGHRLGHRTDAERGRRPDRGAASPRHAVPLGPDRPLAGNHGHHDAGDAGAGNLGRDSPVHVGGQIALVARDGARRAGGPLAQPVSSGGRRKRQKAPIRGRQVGKIACLRSASVIGNSQCFLFGRKRIFVKQKFFCRTSLDNARCRP